MQRSYHPGHQPIVGAHHAGHVMFEGPCGELNAWAAGGARQRRRSARAWSAGCSGRRRARRRTPGLPAPSPTLEGCTLCMGQLACLQAANRPSPVAARFQCAALQAWRAATSAMQRMQAALKACGATRGATLLHAGGLAGLQDSHSSHAARLVLDEGEQRGDDDGEAAREDRRQLVAQRLACSSPGCQAFMHCNEGRKISSNQ